LRYRPARRQRIVISDLSKEKHMLRSISFALAVATTAALVPSAASAFAIGHAVGNPTGGHLPLNFQTQPRQPPQRYGGHAHGHGGGGQGFEGFCQVHPLQCAVIQKQKSATGAVYGPYVPH